MRMNKSIGMLCGILAGICWAIGGIASQYLLNDRGLDLNWLITVKALFAGCILLLIAKFLIKEKSSCRLRERKDIVRILLFTLITFLMQYSFNYSITISGAATTTVLQYLNPIMILMFSAIVYKTKIRSFEWIGVCLAVFGTFLVITHGELSTMNLSGNTLLWGLIAAATMAAYILYPRDLLTDRKSVV